MRFRRNGRHILLGMISLFLSLQMTAAFSKAGTIGLPVASGSERGWVGIRLDYERLTPEIESGQGPFSGPSRGERLLLSSAYAASRFLEFYLKLGLAAYETPSRAFSGSLGPAYGLGVKWTVYQKKSLTLGVGLSVFEFITKDDDSPTSSLKWNEVEAFLGGVLGGFEEVKPYFGLLFSEGRGKFEKGPTVHLKGSTDLFVGAIFRVTDRIDFLSEARLIRENGLSLSLRVDL